MYPCKIRDHDTSGGTALCTRVALDAFLIINRGEIVGNGDRSRWAILLAFAAADTAVRAGGARDGALIVA